MKRKRNFLKNWYDSKIMWTPVLIGKNTCHLLIVVGRYVVKIWILNVHTMIIPYTFSYESCLFHFVVVGHKAGSSMYSLHFISLQSPLSCCSGSFLQHLVEYISTDMKSWPSQSKPNQNMHILLRNISFQFSFQINLIRRQRSCVAFLCC